MKVLNAIKTLLRHKNHCTYSEIASVAGMKKLEVLDILNTNNNLVRKTEDGKIMGLTAKHYIDLDRVTDKYYWLAGINYGADSCICFNGHTDLRKKLENGYCNGGFGDNYMSMVILATEDNIKAVESEGLIRYTEEVVNSFKVEDYWKEDAANPKKELLLD